MKYADNDQTEQIFSDFTYLLFCSFSQDTFKKINCTLPLSDKGGVMALCVGLSEDGEEGDDKQLDTAINGDKLC